jgi:sterol-4alpha-carboxylate 3-dehydrogenase (decarboxylating)
MHRTDVSILSEVINIATRAASVRAFLYSGSVAAIANVSGAGKQPLSEAEAILHSSKTASCAYDLSKSHSTEIVLTANGDALRTAVLHLPGMYGPRDRQVALGIWNMINTPMTKVQLGNNKVVHEWLYVENAAHAHVLAAKALLNSSDTEEKVSGEAFFVTDGVPVKFWDFARNLWTRAGVKDCTPPKVIVPWWCVLTLAAISETIFLVFTVGRKPAPLTRHHVHYMKEGTWFDINKAKDRLHYTPIIQTDEGIQKTVAWFQGTSAAAQHKRR